MLAAAAASVRRAAPSAVRAAVLPVPASPPALLAAPRVPLAPASVRTLATSAARASGAQSPPPPARTGLYDFHVQHGAKMVPFGGFAMPLQYKDQSPLVSHKHVRSAAGLFDVGHMVQHTFAGPGAAAFLESLTPSDLVALAPFSSTLSVLLLPDGGILDDTVITKHASNEAFYVVTNAACRTGDLAFIAAHLDAWARAGKPAVTHTVLDDRGLVALQGPQAAAVLQALTPAALDALTFGRSVFAHVAGVDGCHIARGGYTGEDGFEISIPGGAVNAATVAEALLAAPAVALAGLAARDSLRLEAGMCLYGHDLNESTSPVEGALAWTVAKTRRARADFPGAQRILNELQWAPARRRAGFFVEGPPAREGARILADDQATVVGVVTSGIPSPTLGKNISMGLIKNGFHKRDTPLFFEVRGKLRPGKVTKMPFVANKFYRGSA